MFEIFLIPIVREMYLFISDMFAHDLESVTWLIWKFNCYFENEGLFKVTFNDEHCKCGSYSQLGCDARWIRVYHRALIETDKPAP